MLAATFSSSADLIAKVLDGAGIATVVVGAAIATAGVLANVLKRAPWDDAFRAYRRGLGQAILLGLEFLVAADIIRTVAVAPSFRNVGVLALIVAIRTFLSMTLELEISGRWPWQKRAPAETTTAQR